VAAAPGVGRWRCACGNWAFESAALDLALRQAGRSLHVKLRKGRTEFLAFCRYIRSLYPPEVRLAFVLDSFSPHLTTKTDSRVGDWVAVNNARIADADTTARLLADAQTCRDFPRWRDPDSNRGHHDFQPTRWVCSRVGKPLQISQVTRWALPASSMWILGVPGGLWTWRGGDVLLGLP
jgi:hypothetical protein